MKRVYNIFSFLGSLLLESKIQPDTAYQKQQETLIVWSEGENYDLALSFQEKAGCDEIWEKICQVNDLTFLIKGLSLDYVSMFLPIFDQLKTVAFIAGKKSPAIPKKFIRFSIENFIANISFYALSWPKLNFGCYLTLEIIF